MKQNEIMKHYKMTKNSAILLFIHMVLLACGVFVALQGIMANVNTGFTILSCLSLIALSFDVAYCVVGYKKGNGFFRALLYSYAGYTVMGAIIMSQMSLLTVPLTLEYFAAFTIIIVLAVLSKFEVERWAVCAPLNLILVALEIIFTVINLFTFLNAGILTGTAFTGVNSRIFTMSLFLRCCMAVTVALSWFINYKREVIDEITKGNINSVLATALQSHPEVSSEVKTYLYTAEGPMKEIAAANKEAVANVIKEAFNKFDKDLELPIGTTADTISRARSFAKIQEECSAGYEKALKNFADHVENVVDEIVKTKYEGSDKQ